MSDEDYLRSLERAIAWCVVNEAVVEFHERYCVVRLGKRTFHEEAFLPAVELAMKATEDESLSA